MPRLRSAVAPAALAVLAPAALAQIQYEPVVLVGDPVPGVGLVTSVSDLDVDDFGLWVVEANTDFPDDFQNTVVLASGDLAYREGQTLFHPADHGVNSIGPVYLGENGEVVTTLYVWPQLGGLNFELVHVGQQELLRAGDAPLGPLLTGGTFVAFDEARRNRVGDVLLHATLDDGAQFVEALIRYETNSIGHPTAEFPVAVEGDPVAGVFGTELIEDLVGGPNARAFTDNGLALYQVHLTGPAASEVAWLVNGNVVAQEGAASGVPGRPWTNLSFQPGDVNTQGQTVVVGEVAGDAATKHLIALSGSKYVQSGDPVPGVPGATILNFSQTAPVFLDESNTVLWTANWLDGGLVSGLFHGNQPVAVEGVTQIDGATVVDLYTFQDGFALSPDGDTALFRATLSDGRAGVFRATLAGAMEDVPGCLDNPAKLTTEFGPPGPGDGFTVNLSGNPFGFAIAVLYAGGGPILPGNPCGVPIGAAGELLVALAPKPIEVFSTVTFESDDKDLLVVVPDDPSFAGLEFWLQGAWVDASATSLDPLALSTALRVGITD